MAFFATETTIIASVRITGSDITILKLDKKNNKVLNLYQHPLPERILDYGVVNDQAKLTNTLKIAAIQAKVRESPCIIGFSEEKTFSTTFQAQALKNDDSFNESIRWQAEEILPSDPREYVFDWKKISDPGSKNLKSEILLVAVPKTYLNPLIASSIGAGLKPIACEPISISLSRLAPPGELSFVAEVRRQESTVVLVDGFKIVRLSSVAATPEAVTDKINDMKVFYLKKYGRSPQHIFLCGEGATSSWLQYVEEKTSLKASPTPLKTVAGSPANMLSFAVSFALAQKDITPPKDPQSINLLPFEVQEMYEKVAEKKSLSFGVKAALCTLAITAASMFATFIVLKLQISQIQAQISAEEGSQTQTSYASVAEAAEKANTQARIVSRLPGRDRLTKIMAELEAATPGGITVVSYTLDLPENVLLINGQASTRDALLEFKANLETKDLFNVVTIPLPTLEKQLNIQYSIAVDLSQPS